MIPHWTSGNIISVQLVNVLENFYCESDTDNDYNNGYLNEMSADADSCHGDSDEQFYENDNQSQLPFFKNKVKKATLNLIITSEECKAHNLKWTLTLLFIITIYIR